MSLTQEDLRQIGALLDEKFDEKLEGLRAENEKAHAAIGARIDQLDERLSGRIGSLSEQIDSMAEDVAKIPLIEAEIRQINQHLGNIEERL